MNTKLTRTAKTAICMMCITVAMIIFAFPASAFSQTYGTDDFVNEKSDMLVLVNEPVDITLVKNGTEYDYTYFPVECSDFLTFAGITLTEIDSVSVPADTVLYDNIMIDVSTVEYEQFTAEEPLEYTYDLTEVDTIPKGEMKIITEGEYGIKEVTYLVKLVDGVETEREIVAEEVIVPSVNGTAEYGVGGTVTASDGTVYNYSYKRLMEATAYTYVPGKTTWTTATGEKLRKGIVAVDTKEIPLHTEMYIASDNYEYGYGIAEDTGGAIKGNIVDLAFMTYDECIQFGRRKMWVYFLEK